jgi:hypothetical protein
MAQQVESLNTVSAAAPKTTSLITQISQFLSDLFSWQGAFATSFGIALGVILASQSGLDSANDPDMGQGIAMHAPLKTPQKASIEHVGVIDAAQDIAKVEVTRIEGDTVHLTVTLMTGEVLSEIYIYQPSEL